MGDLDPRIDLRAELPSDDFWESSSLSWGTAAAFGRSLSAYEPVAPSSAHPLVGPGEEVRLAPVNDRFQRSLAARVSGRRFDDRPVPQASVERVLAAVGPTSDGRRTVPEAGGLDAVHAYALLRRVDGSLGGQIVRYDHRRHSVQVVGAVTGDEELRHLLLVDDDIEVLPQVVVLLVLETQALSAKYGERGTRFALQQVGHVTQNLSLRVAHEGLSGYILGGGLDRELLTELGMAHVPHVRYGGAYGFGSAPPAAPRRHR